MNYIDLFQRFSKYPFGKLLFSFLVCLRAPYFGTIRPRFVSLDHDGCAVSVRKRWRIQNHIGTVHAIAICNMAELAAGTYVESARPSHLRWIPKGMSVEYLKKAKTNLICTARQSANFRWAPGDQVVECSVKDSAGVEVFRAHITMYLSENQPKT